MRSLLIVDDEEKIRHMLARFFETRGFSTQMAASGTEALERLEQQAPDCLLLDIRMPDISGLEVLKAAKARYPGITVVMVTAMDDQDLARQAFELGASDYVTKPFGFDDQYWASAFFA